ncbi:MAG: hypothetical protein OER56_08405 [Hyphomicrobiales bacterium]|nr:hypothetical protein [Hyphomicrobiales bacterium]
MDKYQGAQAAENVINLYDQDDLAGGPNASNEVVLDVMAANPRFSAPANDELQLDSPERLAPTRADCRQAQLLCMWIEILAEGEAV